MERPVRSLKTELFSPTRTSIPQQLGCALQQKRSCCDGIGYRLKANGSLTQAIVCECVMECQSCFGLNRRMVDGVSKPCHTPAPSRVASLINAACLPARYCTAKLSSFTNFSGNGNEVVQRLSQWTREFDIENPKGLILGGNVGVGKTYLLAAVAKTFANKGISVRFVDFFQLLLELKAGYAQDKNDSRVLNEAIAVDVLFIDELGKGRNSDWELSILDQLVMGRYNQNKVMIASTNYDFKPSDRVQMTNGSLDNEKRPGSFELDRFESLEQRIGARIYSRLIESSDLIELTGEDFRKRNLQEKIQPTRGVRR
ncbi:MAG: ATP-binding protein [Proteobacteria bacterium]|nr:MAG: ATP-binding protein [Pseudomonadota bacterium]